MFLWSGTKHSPKANGSINWEVACVQSDTQLMFKKNTVLSAYHRNLEQHWDAGQASGRGYADATCGVGWESQKAKVRQEGKYCWGLAIFFEYCMITAWKHSCDSFAKVKTWNKQYSDLQVWGIGNWAPSKRKADLRCSDLLALVASALWFQEVLEQADCKGLTQSWMPLMWALWAPPLCWDGRFQWYSM